MRTTTGRINDLEKRLVALRDEVTRRKHKPRVFTVEDPEEAARLMREHADNPAPVLIVTKAPTSEEPTE